MLFETKIKMWQLWKRYVLNAFKSEREEYHLGWMHLDRTESDLKWMPTEQNIIDVEAKLINIGFQPNYFSFGDKGQVTSMRRMYVDVDGYWRQHHIRIHEDGEVRGHDELSYEESAIDHVKGNGAVEIPVKEHMKILLVIGATYNEDSV